VRYFPTALITFRMRSSKDLPHFASSAISGGVGKIKGIKEKIKEKTKNKNFPPPKISFHASLFPLWQPINLNHHSPLHRYRRVQTIQRHRRRSLPPPWGHPGEVGGMGEGSRAAPRPRRGQVVKREAQNS